MPEYSVVVTDHDFESLDVEREVLGDVAEVIELKGTVGADAGTSLEDELLAADAVLNLRRPLEADDLERMADCRIVARYGTGVDNVDLEAATAAGIPVTKVPDYCQEEVATHALSLSLALLRGLKPFDDSVASGRWQRDDGPRIRRLSAQTVGVVGFGAIGRAVADRFRALDATVVASDPYVEPEEAAEHGVELLDFENVLDRADLLTVHSPLTSATRELIDADALDRLDDDAYLINVARGPIVDASALRDALESGSIAGAGLDVFPEEPPAQDDPLRDHPDVITTPHVAWYSEEANAERRRRAAENVRRALTGESLENVVNDVESA